MHGYARRRAFTLLELLIAMVLASLLAVLTYSGLQLGLRSWEVSERRQQALESRFLTSALLRRLLESPQQVLVRDTEGELQMAYRGQADGVIFIARLPQVDNSPQLYWLQLAQTQTEDGPNPRSWQLLLRYLPYDGYGDVDWQLLGATLDMDAQQEVLLSELIEPLQFAFLEQRTGREPDWQPQWQRHEQLPGLLRVSSPHEGELQLTVGPRELAYAIKIVE